MDEIHCVQSFMLLCQNKPVQRRLKVVFLLCLILVRRKRACGSCKHSDHSSCTPMQRWFFTAEPKPQPQAAPLLPPQDLRLRKIEMVSFSYTHQGTPGGYGQGVTQAHGAQYPLRQVPSRGMNAETGRPIGSIWVPRALFNVRFI